MRGFLERIRKGLSEEVSIQAKGKGQLYIHIPKQFAEALGLSKGQKVRIILDPIKGRLILELLNQL